MESYGTDTDGGPVGDTDTDGDTEGPMPENGHLWCVNATNALFDDTGGSGWTPIYLPDSMNNPQGCSCAPDELHEWLAANAVNGEVDVSPSASPPQDIETFRLLVYNDAEYNCADTAPEGFVNNCDPGNTENGALDTAPTTPGFQYPKLHMGDYDLVVDCVIPRYYINGEYQPPGEDCSFIDGIYNFTVSATGALEVDKGLVSDIIQAPGCLYLEGGRIEANSNGYEFSGISRTELLWELGLRNGDVPEAINGYDITTVDGAYAAWSALQSESDFELTVSRPHSGSITLKFTLI